MALENWKSWEQKRVKFVTKCNNALNVFNTRLGRGPKSVIESAVNNGHWRLAWKTLDRHYTSELSEGSAKISVIESLNELTFSDAFTFEQHVRRLENLCEIAGYQNDESMKISYLYRSFKQSKCKDFNNAISSLRYNDVNDYERIISTLKRQDDDRKRERKVKRKLEGNEHVNTVQKERKMDWKKKYSNTKNVNTAQKDFKKRKLEKKNLNCSNCGKSGHDSEHCWNVIPCERCGKLGHPAWLCRNNASSSANTTAADDDAKPKVVKVKSMFTNKHVKPSV
jgi:hypothetical protein